MPMRSNGVHVRLDQCCAWSSWLRAVSAHDVAWQRGPHSRQSLIFFSTLAAGQLLLRSQPYAVVVSAKCAPSYCHWYEGQRA